MDEMRLEVVENPPPEVACSCSGVPPLPADAPFDAHVVAAHLRHQLGEGPSICVHEGGEVFSFGRPGEEHTAVRTVRGER